MCEQAPGPVPTSDSGRAGQEEAAELQDCRLMTSDQRSITCTPEENCLISHKEAQMWDQAAETPKYPVIY